MAYSPAAFDPTITALAAYNTNGVVTQTAADTFAGRTVTGTANLITVTNGDGVAGNPTLTVGNNVYRIGGTDVGLGDGGTGSSLGDPNADRIMFWDDSAGAVDWLAVTGGLTITGTTLSGESGVYTPTFTNVANVASFGTVSDATYCRTGNAVTISGRVSIDPTAASVNTQFRMSLPIASNFTLFTDVGGTCNAKDSASIAIAICADTVNDQANFQYINTAETAAREFAYIFQYVVK